MLKGRIKLLILALVSVFAVSCLAGCNNEKDVFGAASEYIKVSHPDKPVKNAFSDEEEDGAEKSGDSASDSDSKNGDSKSGTSSDATSASDSASSDKNSDKTASSNEGSNGGKTSSESGNNDNSSAASSVTVKGNGSTLESITYDPTDGDYGPVVTF